MVSELVELLAEAMTAVGKHVDQYRLELEPSLFDALMLEAERMRINKPPMPMPIVQCIMMTIGGPLEITKGPRVQLVPK